MKKTRLMVITVVLGLSLGAGIQFGTFNGLGNDLASVVNTIFPGFGTHTGGSNVINDNSFTNPGYQGVQKEYFSYQQQGLLLTQSFGQLDGGFSTNSINSQANVGNGFYFDFESGYSSSEPFSTADFYFSNSDNGTMITPVNNAIAGEIGIVPFDSVNQNVFLSTELSSYPIFADPETQNFDNGTVIVFLTGEGTEIRMSIDFASSSLAITYSSIYYFSINGNEDFRYQARINEWPGNGTSSSPILIENYEISSLGGIMIQNTNLYFVIQNNYFNGQGMDIPCIFINNVANGAFSSNDVSGYSVGFDITGGSSLNFGLNTVSNNNNQGFLMQFSRSSSFTNNNVNDNGKSGILVSNSTEVIISSNQFSQNSIVAIDNPSILTAGVNFIYSSGSISKNTFRNNYGNGILLFGDSGNLVESNTVNSNGENGISVLGSDSLTINSNTVDGNTGQGISVSSSIYLTVSNNIITGNGSQGLYWVNSSYSTISGNTITSNSQIALTNLKPNGLKGLSYSAGMFMDPSFFNVVENNIVSGNGVGISLIGSDLNVFSSNTVTNNSFDGFDIMNSSSNIVSQNIIGSNTNPNTLASIIGSAKIGVFSGLSYSAGMFMDPSSNNTLSNNVFDANYGYGLYVSNSDFNTIDSNSMSGNGLNGAFIEESSYNSITNNVLSGNSNPVLQTQYLNTYKTGSATGLSYSAGMFMDPSTYNIVSNNEFTSNYGDGLQVSQSSYNVFTSNSANNNAFNGMSVLESNNNNITLNTLTGNSNPVLQSEFLSYGKVNGFTGLSYSAGMFMDPSSNNNVFGNFIGSNYGYGAWVQESTYNSLDSNSFNGNGINGIFVDNSNYNSFTNNDISSNSNATLQLAFMNFANNFKSGSITGLSYSAGMFMDPSVGNYVSGNTFSNNIYGVYVQASNNNVFDQNSVTNSGLNGVVFENATYNNVTYNNVTGSGNTALLSSFLSYGKINGFTGLSYSAGMFMDPSFGNFLSHNSFSSNNGYGLVSQDSNNNAIVNNHIDSNSQYGFYSLNSNTNVLTDNAFVSNVLYGTFFDSNSHNSNIGNNNFVQNALNLNTKQAYDDGGNSYSGNFFLDENPNTAYVIAGSSGSKDTSVSISPSIDLSFLKLAPVQFNTYIFPSSFNVKSGCGDFVAWVYFGDSYSSYLANKSSLYIEWNGNTYHVERAGTWGSHWLYLKFDRNPLARDLYNYLTTNKLSDATVTLTVHGAFNGGFLQFYGSQSVHVFKWSDNHDHNRGRD